jgi:hypothetical protein
LVWTDLPERRGKTERREDVGSSSRGGKFRLLSLKPKGLHIQIQMDMLFDNSTHLEDMICPQVCALWRGETGQRHGEVEPHIGRELRKTCVDVPIHLGSHSQLVRVDQELDLSRREVFTSCNSESVEPVWF